VHIVATQESASLGSNCCLCFANMESDLMVYCAMTDS